MSEGGASGFGKFLLAVCLLVLSGVIIYEVNQYYGKYLNLPLWLGGLAILGIFDIAVYYSITRPRR